VGYYSNHQFNVMKRSKIYLGITASLLAIVGIAAAKAHKSTTAVRGYYTNPLGHACTLQSSPSFYTIGAAGRVAGDGFTKIATAGNGTVLHQNKLSSAGACISAPLYTAAHD
jgi:hypothetical protein